MRPELRTFKVLATKDGRETEVTTKRAVSAEAALLAVANEYVKLAQMGCGDLRLGYSGWRAVPAS